MADLECGAVSFEELRTILHGDKSFNEQIARVRQALRDIEQGKDPAARFSPKPAADANEQRERAAKTSKKLRQMLRKAGSG